MSLIHNEEELQINWQNKSVKSWVANDGVGDMTNIFRENVVAIK